MTKAELLYELQHDSAFREELTNSLLAGVELLHWEHDPERPAGATNPPEGSVVVALFSTRGSREQIDYIATSPIKLGGER